MGGMSKEIMIPLRAQYFSYGKKKTKSIITWDHSDASTPVRPSI